MILSTHTPPNWDEVNAFFRIEELGLKPLFTYGSTIYNPFGLPVSQDLIVHERVHMEQHQHHDTIAKLWWRRYLADPDFRLDQEVEAYAAQYQFLCTQTTDRERKNKIALALAAHLSGPMYGNIIGRLEAMAKIRGYPPKKVSLGHPLTEKM